MWEVLASVLLGWYIDYVMVAIWTWTGITLWMGCEPLEGEPA